MGKPENAYPGFISYIEGPNEADGSGYSYNGVANAPGANTNQQVLYGLVKAAPALAAIAVSAWPLGNPGNASEQGNQTGYANIASIHAYNWTYSQTGISQMQSHITTEKNIVFPSGPFMVTETGYPIGSAQFNSGYCVDQLTQARLIIDAILDVMPLGLQAQYLYDLIDDNQSGANTEGNVLGIFDGSNNPKISATAIKNLIAILTDTGSNAATFIPGQLNYTVTGLPSTGNSTLIGKSTGAFDIALWNEQPIWNSTTQTEITFSTVAVYDPITGSTPIATYSNVSQIQVGLNADALIVEATP